MSNLFLNTSRAGYSFTSLGSLFQCLTTFCMKKFFLVSSLNLPWPSLAMSCCPIAIYLGEDTEPCLATATFLVLVENDKVPLRLFFSGLNTYSSLSHSSYNLC